jgi:hypothetical protein
VGDYARRHDKRIVAIVERKTLDNLLDDLVRLKGLQQQLAEPAACPHGARVLEAQYRCASGARSTGCATKAG